MMEEVSITLAYDAQSVDQMSEEEILACLVAEARPKSTVPTKKPKLRECPSQPVEEDEDPINRYQRENWELQQTNLRLEQENDNLAHRLVTSKIALRSALDQAEDRVDELTKELLQTQHCLKATEEEKRREKEEAAILKEVFRRGLENAEQELTRSSGIITDYKQICSQLASRLEGQQVGHRDELEALKTAVMACSRCRKVLEPREQSDPGQAGRCSPAAEPVGPGPDLIQHLRSTEGREARRREREEEALSSQIRRLERELAQTKLQMVEAKCKIQDLEHQNGLLQSDLQAAKNSWFRKTFTSLRTAGGGLHGFSLPSDGAPSAGLVLSSGPLSGWSTKRLSWSYKDTRGNISNKK